MYVHHIRLLSLRLADTLLLGERPTGRSAAYFSQSILVRSPSYYRPECLVAVERKC
jgi:hypothetical protein